MDSQEANIQWTKLFIRSIADIGNVSSFRQVAQIGFYYAKHLKQKEYVNLILDMLHKPEYEGIIRDPDSFVKEGYEKKMLPLLMQSLKTSFESAVDAASLVLAHSIVDNLCYRLCWLCGQISADDWLQDVENMKVDLRRVISEEQNILLSAKVNEYLGKLERESLLRKAEVLHAKCKPVNLTQYLEGYSYDRERLEKLDTLRHKIVHGGIQNPRLPNGDADIDYLRLTCVYFALMVHDKHGLVIDKDTLEKNEVYKD